MASKNVTKLDVEKFKPSTEVMELSMQLEAVVGHNPITHAFKLANVIAVVQQWVQHPEITKLLAQLENTHAGFKTDINEPGKSYPPKIRAQCVTDALVNGIRLNGNEFNIISGKMMIVQNGWRRLCEEMGQKVPGGFSPDSNYETVHLNCYDEGEPKINGNISTIHMCIDYELMNKGTGELETGKFERDISITIKSRDTVDAWIGKAERRMYRSFFRKFAGKSVPEGDTAEEFNGEVNVKTKSAAVPPTGSTQKSKERPANSKVQVAPPEPAERPNTTLVDKTTGKEIPVEDAEYTEAPDTNPAMEEAIGNMAGEPDMPPPPPEGTQGDLLPPEPKPAPVTKTNPTPAASSSNRPKTNF